jgi:hypothetical protein
MAHALIREATSTIVALVLKNAHPANSAPMANAYSIAPPDKPLALAPASTSVPITIIAAVATINAPAVGSAPMANAYAQAD